MHAVVAYLARMIRTGFEVPQPQLAVFRILYGLYLLLFASIPDARFIADYPAGLLDPPPGLPWFIAEWFGGSPALWFILVVELVVIVSAVLVTIGFRTPVASLVLGISGITSSALLFSTGKVDHSIMLWLVPLTLYRSGWGAAASVDAIHPTGKAPVRSSPSVAALAMVLGIGFLTAAGPKIVGGWLSLSESATFGHILQNQFVRSRDELLAGMAPDWDLPVFWELVDWGTIAFELAVGLGFLLGMRMRWLLVGAYGFHLSVFMLMNISFHSLVIVYVVFFVGALSADRAQRVDRLVRSAMPAVVALMIALGVVRFVGSAGAARLVLRAMADDPVWADGIQLALFPIGLLWLGVWGRRPRPASVSAPSAPAV